jgi:hypothetical protein
MPPAQRLAVRAGPWLTAILDRQDVIDVGSDQVAAVNRAQWPLEQDAAAEHLPSLRVVQVRPGVRFAFP